MGDVAAGGAMRGPRGGRVSGGDAEAQRALNAQAPKIPHLFGRIVALFAPHRASLILTAVLVIVAAGLSVVPPLLTQRAFDEGLFPTDGGGPQLARLTELVVLMIAVYVVSTLLGAWQTFLTSTVGNRVMGALRVRMFTHLQSM